MKRKAVSALLCMSMVVGMLAGCGSTDAGSAGSTASADTPYSGQKVSIMWVSNSSMDGINAVVDAAEKELGIEVDVEQVPGGEDGDNVVKTRLASGDMTDLLSYNCGSLLASLNPSEYFADITSDYADKLDENFVEAAGVDGTLYGIPASASQAGAVLYNLDMYEKYNLEIPKTWDEFLANCDVLREAGETAVLGTDGDSWTSQVPYLGDQYNVQAADANFAEDFEAGKTKYATSEAGLESFQKIEDLIPYMNEDHMATTYDDGCDIMMEDGAAHWIILTSALSNMYELYEDDVNKLGCFAVPGRDAENCGLTVWEPNAIYMNKDTDNSDAVKAFMDFYVSDAGLDAFTGAELPNGPYCIKGYELPEECYTAVKQMQADYFDTGLNSVALEFQTAVKGSNCAAICQELASGQTTAAEAAAKYDEDCKKQAVQLGLNW
ncbi:MAG: ABC transporter substrate-binding protein [Hespellia sp.]|nr:ABC transporter substrate-binding protein [Hespellia sp.]